MNNHSLKQNCICNFNNPRQTPLSKKLSLLENVHLVKVGEFLYKTTKCIAKISNFERI